MKSTDKFVLVLVASLALLLAGCGGGSSSTPDPDPDPPVVDPAVAERAAINTAIMAARTAVSGVDNDSTDTEVSAAGTAIENARTAIANAANVPAAEKAANTTTVDTLAAQLTSAKMARSDAMTAANKAAADAMAKVGKALRAALGPPESSVTPQNALGNIAAPTLSSDGLEIDAANGAGALGDGTGGTTAVNPASVTLEAGDAAGSLGSWMGMDYAYTDSDSKVKNEARVYTNRGSTTTKPFVERYGPTGTTPNPDLAALGHTYSVSARTLTFAAAADSNIVSTHFPTAGAQTFTGAQDFQGTYDGASGNYKCAAASTCTATYTSTGIELSVGWTFVHGSGARVSTPDSDYLYYGWWVSKDKDGGPTAASAFTGVVGTITAGTSVGTDAPQDIAGKATYTGSAAGKFAMSNTLDGTGSGGHFTADAELKATFGANDTDAPASTTTGGITGTIDNFRLNDGSADPGWSVTLHRANWDSTTAGMFATPADQPLTTAVNESMGTTWSINDNASPRSGTWSGQMYDEKPGTAPTGDGSNIPTTATGTFYSEFSSIGRMVGAFGVDKE